MERKEINYVIRSSVYHFFVILKKNIILAILAFFIFCISTIFITFPLVLHMGDLVTGFGDELNYAWMFNWVIYVLTSGNILFLFDTNIFYPYNIALANSDPNLITSILSIPSFLLIKEPIAVVNFTLISSICLLGFSTYQLSYYLTKDFLASLLSGILVIFSPAVLSFYVHIQMLAIEWVPYSILFIFIFIRTKKLKYLVVSLLFFLIQVYNSFIPGYFILFSYVVIYFFTWIYDKRQAYKLITKRLILLFLVTCAAIIPIVYPYVKVSRDFNYIRDIKDTVHFAIQPEDFLYSSSFSRFYGYLNNLPFNKTSQNGEFKPGYLGMTFSFLTIFTLYYFVKNFKKKFIVLNSFVCIAIIGFVLSLGPVLHLGRHTTHEPFVVPLPYAVFYYTLPGFQGFRNSARWEMLLVLGMSIAIAVAISTIFKKSKLKFINIVYIVLIALTILEFNFPMKHEKIEQVRDFPAVYNWLSTTPSGTKIVEFPIYHWRMASYSNIEFLRMYYATIHFRKTINGGGGFTPPPWEKMMFYLDADFPSDESIRMLKNIEINYVIVHKNEYDMLYKDKYTIDGIKFSHGDTVIKILEKKSKTKKVKKFNDDYVYEIL